MGLFDNFRRALSSLIHPGAESSGKIGIGKALSIYYPVAVLGLVLALIVYYAYSSATSTFIGSYSHAILLAAIYLILVPIGIFIDAAIYHLVGKHFLRAWKGDYSKTFAAYTFAVIPFASLYWIAQVPALRIPTAAIIGLWSIVMLVVAVASQHKIRRTDAAVVGIVTAVIALIVTFLLFAIAVVSTAPLLSPLV